MIEPGSEVVKIDVAHADLIYGLVRANKPNRVLEFGFGGGRACRAILDALVMNRNESYYCLVDNWSDWGGLRPVDLDITLKDTQLKATDLGAHKSAISIDVLSSSEGYFVGLYSDVDIFKYDFIMADADHHHSHEWFADVYQKLLGPGGILIYHDVDGTYPGLASLVKVCQTWDFAFSGRMNFKVFNKSSRVDERCERGLLVIFKPEA